VSSRLRRSSRGFDLSDGFEVSLCPAVNLRDLGLHDLVGVNVWEMIARPLLEWSIELEVRHYMEFQDSLVSLKSGILGSVKNARHYLRHIASLFLFSHARSRVLKDNQVT